MIPPPFIAKAQENVWCWTTGEGFFRAVHTTHNTEVRLDFRRWLGDTYVPRWDTVWTQKRKTPGAKEFFTEIVAAGPLDWIAKHDITLALPAHLEARFALPEKRTITRTIMRDRYTVAWVMYWNAGSGPCTNLRGHWCGANIHVWHRKRDVYTDGRAYFYQALAMEPERFNCQSFDDGWQRFGAICTDLKSAIMEEKL